MGTPIFSPEQIARLVRSAVLAPSSHNTQPWRFRTFDSGIDMVADRTRALPVNDPDDRELHISCGCALMNLRIAAAAEQLPLELIPLPYPDQPEWIARLTLTEGDTAENGTAELLPFLERRHTYRNAFNKEVVEEPVVHELREAARMEHAIFHGPLSVAQRQRTAALVAEGDAVQWANPEWRAELAAWMHPAHRGDGLTIPAVLAPLIRYFVRTFDLGSRVSKKDHTRVQQAPLLAVLATERDSPRAWLDAGQALQRVLLTGCRRGLQTGYFNQPLQVAALRPQLQEVLGEQGYPQLLVGMGYPRRPATRTPRRPVAEVLSYST